MNKIETSLAETFSEWVHKLNINDVPEDVVDKLQLIVMDSFGLMVSAKNQQYIKSLINALQENGDCTLVGHNKKVNPFNASIINGTAIHGEDFDDTFEGTPVHVGSVMVPAMLSSAQAKNLDGEKFLKGLVVGSELICRLALVAPTAVHRQGFHPTAIFGAFGSSIGVSSLLGNTIDEMSSGLGIVGSMASGIIEYLAEGTSTKRLHPGWAAGCGWQSANFAKSGFLGPRTVFEGQHGVFNSFAKNNIEPNFSHIISDLGNRWESKNLALKPYACGTMAQPFIDCAIKLKDKIDNVENIDKVIASVGEGTVHRLWEPLEEKQNPSTPYGAKFSVPYCVAVGMIFGDAGLLQFTEQTLADNRVIELAQRVAYVINPEDPYPRDYVGWLEVHTKAGTVHHFKQPCMRGGKNQPMTDSDIKSKFIANCSYGGLKHEDALLAFHSLELFFSKHDSNADRLFSELPV